MQKTKGSERKKEVFFFRKEEPKQFHIPIVSSLVPQTELAVTDSWKNEISLIAEGGAVGVS